MDIRSLKYFVVAAQEKNITKAAEKLFIAQPPLSRQIKLLEEELGVNLFIRGKRQLQLTEEGRYLKQQAEEILYLMGKTKAHLKMMSGSECGTISICATETCSIRVLSNMIDEFHKLFPNIRIQIWTGDSDEIQDRLEKNIADIGIIREPIRLENYDRIFLHSDSWVIICNKNNRLAKQDGDGIELSVLQNEPLIIPARESVQREINSWLNDIAYERNIFCLYNAIGSVLDFAERDLGVIISPASIRGFINSETLSCKNILPNRVSNVFIVKRRYQVMNTALERFWTFALNYRNSSREK